MSKQTSKKKSNKSRVNRYVGKQVTAEEAIKRAGKPPTSKKIINT